MIDAIFNVNVQMPFELARIFVAVAGTAVASYFDITNNKTIPNKVTYSFLAIAVLFALSSLDPSSIIYSFGIAAAVFALGYAMYMLGQIGGADIFILSAIALLLPLQPTSLLITGEFPISFPFVLSVIISGGLLFSLAMVFRFAPKAFTALLKGKVRLTREKYAYSALILATYLVFVYVASSLPFFPLSYVLLFSFVVLASTFFMVFREYISDSMIEYVPLEKIDEEDILAVDKIPEEKVKKYNLKKLLTENELKRLKREKVPIKKFPVYTGLPMLLPYLLVGLVFSIIFGDVIFLAAGSIFSY